MTQGSPADSPEHPPAPPPEADLATRTTEEIPVSRRWMPPEELASPQDQQSREGRHRAPVDPEESLPSHEVAMTDSEQAYVRLYLAWASRETGLLRKMWLGDEGTELDERLPHAGIRDGAKYCLGLILGEDEVKSIEAAYNKQNPTSGRVAATAVSRHRALTEPVMKLPVIQPKSEQEPKTRVDLPWPSRE